MVHGVFDFVPVETKVEFGQKISLFYFDKSVLIQIGRKTGFICAVPRFLLLEKHGFMCQRHAHVYVPSRREDHIQRVDGR